MEFNIIPLTVRISKDDYSFFILGFHWGNRTSGIGFNYSSYKYPDRKEWSLYLSFWTLYRRLKVRTIYDSYDLVCNECGNSVWKHSLYCPECCESVDYEDTTRVELNK